MAKVLTTANGKCLLNGNKVLMVEPVVPHDIIVVPGGTATGVTTTKYTQAEETSIKAELVSAGKITAEEAASASVLNISGTSAGTVILDITCLGNVGDPVLIVHKKQDDTWETLYSGEIPSTKQVTVTLTEFSPLVGAPHEGEPKYTFTSWAGKATGIDTTYNGYAAATTDGEKFLCVVGNGNNAKSYTSTDGTA